MHIHKEQYATAAEELRLGKVDPALWAKAFAEASGDQEATTANYLRMRAKELQSAISAQSVIQAISRVRTRWDTIVSGLLELIGLTVAFMFGFTFLISIIAFIAIDGFGLRTPEVDAISVVTWIWVAAFFAALIYKFDRGDVGAG